MTSIPHVCCKYDTIALHYCPLSLVKVKDRRGVRENGMYQQMHLNEFLQFTGYISGLTNWGTDCNNTGVLCGKLYHLGGLGGGPWLLSIVC